MPYLFLNMWDKTVQQGMVRIYPLQRTVQQGILYIDHPLQTNIQQGSSYIDRPL
jgi:hypothetical protein